MATLKRAIQRLVRGVDGRTKLILIDLDTGVQVIDPAGYRIVSQGELVPEEVEDVDQPDVPTTVEEVIKPREKNDGSRADFRSSTLQSPTRIDQFPPAPSLAGTKPSAPLSGVRTPVSSVQKPATQTSILGTPQPARADENSTPTPIDSRPSSGFVKTAQGSVLPDLEYDRFSPPTAPVGMGGYTPPSSPASVSTTRGVTGMGGYSPPTPSVAASTNAGAVAQSSNNQPSGFVGRPSTVDYSTIGGNRPNPVSPAHEKYLSDVASSVTGTGSKVSVTSGDVDPDQPGWTAEGGKYSRSHRHTDLMGADVQITDPRTGKVVTDPVAIGDLAMNAAAMNPKVGIGFGPGYMGPETMHIDQSGKGGIWGGGLTQTQIDNVNLARSNGIKATPYYDAPTPTARPDYSPEPAIASMGGSVFDTPAKTTAQGIISEARGVASAGERIAQTDLSGASPAKMASLGFTQRTPEQLDLMSKAIAGELSSKTMEGLKVGDPVAQRELANVVATIENRAASAKYGTLEKALVGSQYNSLMAENLKNTNELTSKYGSAVQQGIKDFYAGKITPTNYGLTSYHNPDLVTPDWSGGMANQALVGDHNFGSLPEYRPGADFNSERDRLAAAQVSDTRGFTPSTGLAGVAKESSGLNSAGNRATGAGPMSSKNTITTKEGNNTGAGGSSSGKTGAGSQGGGGGLNSAGNRGSGAGPSASKNTSVSNSPSKEASSSKGKTSSGSVSSGGGHYAE